MSSFAQLRLYAVSSTRSISTLVRYARGERDWTMPERTMSDPVLESTLTCPACGHVQDETMPVDACQYFYECPGCHAILQAKPGDCCVFCSYGSVRCPPRQMGGDCCT